MGLADSSHWVYWANSSRTCCSAICFSSRLKDGGACSSWDCVMVVEEEEGGVCWTVWQPAAKTEQQTIEVSKYFGVKVISGNQQIAPLKKLVEIVGRILTVLCSTCCHLAPARAMQELQSWQIQCLAGFFSARTGLPLVSSSFLVSELAMEIAVTFSVIVAMYQQAGWIESRFQRPVEPCRKRRVSRRETVKLNLCKDGITLLNLFCAKVQRLDLSTEIATGLCYFVYETPLGGRESIPKKKGLGRGRIDKYSHQVGECNLNNMPKSNTISFIIL